MNLRFAAVICQVCLKYHFNVTFFRSSFKRLEFFSLCDLNTAKMFYVPGLIEFACDM